MINYNKLFDIAYSDTIPESVKDSILDSVLDSIGEELNEDLQEEGSRCVGILENLALSNMSCSLVNSIIDRAFTGLNEDFINEVSDAFVNRAAKSALASRKAQRFSSGSSPIGLKGVQREARIQHAQDVVNKTEAPKPSALDRLKGAVNKVKQAWGSNNKPVGLSSFKSNNPSIEEIKKSDAEIRDHAVKMGTGDGSKTTNIKVQPAASKPKAEPVTTSKTKTTTGTKKTTTGTKKTTTASKTTGAKKTTGKSSKKASKAASNIAANIKQAEEVKPAAKAESTEKEPVLVSAPKAKKTEPNQEAQNKKISDEAHAATKAFVERADKEEADRKAKEQAEIERRRQGLEDLKKQAKDTINKTRKSKKDKGEDDKGNKGKGTSKRKKS